MQGAKDTTSVLLYLYTIYHFTSLPDSQLVVKILPCHYYLNTANREPFFPIHSVKNDYNRTLLDGGGFPGVAIRF